MIVFANNITVCFQMQQLTRLHFHDLLRSAEGVPGCGAGVGLIFSSVVLTIQETLQLTVPKLSGSLDTSLSHG